MQQRKTLGPEKNIRTETKNRNADEGRARKHLLAQGSMS